MLRAENKRSSNISAAASRRYISRMADLDFLPFDADNHYYEGLDAFTRHVDPKWHQRCVQWCDIGGRKHHVVGGVVSHAVKNPTWDPIAKPGALHDFFRGNPDGRSPLEMLAEREPLPAEYIDKDARVAKLEQQGLESVWLFPTLGVLYEELIHTDIEAVKHLFAGFNQWLLEDWGFNYQDKIYAAPYMALGDVDFAVSQLEWSLDNGASVVCMRPAPVWTDSGFKSPGDEYFDPFWNRVNEAGIAVVVHAADSGYKTNGYANDGFGADIGASGAWKPTIKAFNIERAAYDWLITMSFERMYERFPNLRIASVENGSDFLGQLFRKLDQTARKYPGYFKADPIELYKEHVWMNPFWEDDVTEVAELMGADRVIFGSDWPHIEGMPQPLDYLVELKTFDDADQKKILLDNVTELNTLRPA